MSWSKPVGTVLMALSLLAIGPSARAESEVEELRKEVRSLRAEVSALRVALSEAAELDRQRANTLTRALDRSAGSGGSNASAPPPPPPPVAMTPPPPAASSEPPPPPPRARPRQAASEVGSISGKVSLPSGDTFGYVYVENIRGGAVNGKSVVIEQSGKQFNPRWAVIQRGTSISFPNQDNIYHNVFSRSAGNTFDLGLYNAAEKAKSYTFMNAGPVDVYCNIHPKMSASILVVPNQYFAKVGSDGSFTLANVPAGRRKVVAWAPNSQEASEWVELDPSATAQVNLKLEEKNGSHKNKLNRPYGSYP